MFSFQSPEILNISRNKIEGDTFPDRFLSKSLKTIDLSFNNLNTTFDISSLTGLINIEKLHMANCSISSNIPDDINILQSLITLDFDTNLLYGTIPSSLGEISLLENILFGSNELTGTIPSELAQLKNLTMLELQFNSLTGEIPGEFDTFTGLNFNYSGNALTIPLG